MVSYPFILSVAVGLQNVGSRFLDEAFVLEDLLRNREIPLLSRTPEGWAELVLRDPLALLNDHAYLEKKAATNALELLNRWPEPSCPEEWTLTLAAIASDEASHLSTVVRILVERGGRLERTHRNDYANRLRLHVRKGQGSDELVDRLLISALIELRSCERFDLLAQHCRGRDATLIAFTTAWARRSLVITTSSCGSRAWPFVPTWSKLAGARCSTSRPPRWPPSHPGLASTAAGLSVPWPLKLVQRRMADASGSLAADRYANAENCLVAIQLLHTRAFSTRASKRGKSTGLSRTYRAPAARASVSSSRPP